MPALIKSLTINQHDLLQYFPSMAVAVVTDEKMEQLGWAWVRAGSYASYQEGPTFAFKGSNDRVRYNIRPWKKAGGTFVWRCHHPAFKNSDVFVEFLDPV